MTLFGEIVEPSTRALLDDDYAEYPEYSKPDIIWEGNINVKDIVKIDTLFFVEGAKVTKLFTRFLPKLEFQCSLKLGGLEIYKLGSADYVVFFEAKELSTGEIIQELELCLKIAKNIYALTSEPISAYQNVDLNDKPETLIRVVHTKGGLDKVNYTKLESPNLVSGLGADVLSFCSQRGFNSILFVIYMDNSPLDSLNTRSVVDLFKSLKLPVQLTLNNLNSVSNNLYL